MAAWVSQIDPVAVRTTVDVEQKSGATFSRGLPDVGEKGIDVGVGHRP